MWTRSHTLHKRPSRSLRPDFIAESVMDIDFAYLRRLGITTCFIDLDGTVVGRGTFAVDPELNATLKASGMDIKITTNRPKSHSLQSLKSDLNASGVVHPNGIYGKPLKRYFAAALRDYSLKNTEVVMIGDRLFNDILGANSVGIYSLVVYKLGNPAGLADRLFSYWDRKLTARMTGKYQKLTR